MVGSDRAGATRCVSARGCVRGVRVAPTSGHLLDGAREPARVSHQRGVGRQEGGVQRREQCAGGGSRAHAGRGWGTGRDGLEPPTPITAAGSDRVEHAAWDGSSARPADARSGRTRFEEVLWYIKNKEDVENIALNNYKGIPVRVKDIGSVQMGGDLRLGIFDADGKGEVVGGIVVMRYNENADKVIAAVKEKMKEVQKGLPEGVTFKTSYDRSTLIEEAVQSVKGTLTEEMIAVSVIVIIFLFHWRSALVILIQLPISVAIGFIFLEAFGISSNIMSLTGIALAISVVVDDGIVMVENSYRHLSEAQTAKGVGK